MRPSESQIKKLSNIQRTVITRLQLEGMMVPRDHRELRVLKILDVWGVVTPAPEGCLENAWMLKDIWKEIDVSRPKRRPRGPYRSVTKDIRPPDEKPSTADKPKDFVRPPSVYSNVSREQLMDRILNS